MEIFFSQKIRSVLGAGVDVGVRFIALPYAFKTYKSSSKLVKAIGLYLFSLWSPSSGWNSDYVDKRVKNSELVQGLVNVGHERTLRQEKVIFQGEGFNY